MVDPKFTSPVSGFLYINQENEIPISLSGKSVSISLCDRNSFTDNLGNYFVSLNLPASSDDFPMNSSMTFFYPELQQLNVDKILLIKIPNTAYTEYIDARSVELNLPIRTVNPHAPFTTGQSTTYKIFSTTYSNMFTNKYGETSPLLGDNIAYLFSDSVNLPYTGLTVNELGDIQDHSKNISWNPVTRSYKDRISAVSYGEVKLSNDTINTDRRYRINKAVFIDGLFPDFRGTAIGYYDTYFTGDVGFYVLPDRNFFKVGDYVTIDEFDHNWNPTYSGNTQITNIIKNIYASNLKYAPEGYNGPYDVIVVNKGFVYSSSNESGILYTSGGTYYNYDIPVGFVVLDKGLIAITHPDIVNNIFWTTGLTQNNISNTSGLTTDIYFTHTAETIYSTIEPACQLKFVSLDTVLGFRATCNAAIGDFYISSNPTWSKKTALNQFSANDPVEITEVGLYNELNELVAVSRFSEPISKTVLDILTFEIDINL